MFHMKHCTQSNIKLHTMFHMKHRKGINRMNKLKALVIPLLFYFNKIQWVEIWYQPLYSPLESTMRSFSLRQFESDIHYLSSHHYPITYIYIRKNS